MGNKISTVAFDLGGVLAYQDFSLLTEEEKQLFNIYMHRDSIIDMNLVMYAQTRMQEIYLKLHKLKKDSISTLEFLLDRRIRMSIWTNNIPEINAWLEEVGIYRFIDKLYVVNSYYLGTNKPSLDFYRSALKILKNSPTEVLFLDDSLKNVTGALNLGINSMQYEEKDSLLDAVNNAIRKGR